MSKPTPDPIYPAYAVGDTDSDNEVTGVAAVTGLRSDHNQLEDLLRRVISTAERPAPKPELSDMEKLIQQWVREPPNRQPAAVNPPVRTRLEQMLRSFLDGQRQRQRQPSRQRPPPKRFVSVSAARMAEGKDAGGFHFDTCTGDNGSPAGGKRRLIREGGPASRVRDHFRPWTQVGERFRLFPHNG